MTTHFDQFGFIRCAAFAPPIRLADPDANAQAIIERLRVAPARQIALALFPELAITGFTAEDLFFSQQLQDRTRVALASIVVASRQLPLTVVVGAPWAMQDGRLFNCAFVISDGVVLGAVPKQHLPNSGEFYDKRWFVSGAGIDVLVQDSMLGEFRLTARQLFAVGELHFAIEICEDLWAPQPPGAEHALAGADLILNPSASNELVAKADYRRDLVRMASAQWVCGYLYASSGPSESSKDVVFGGHLIAAENGALLGESDRFALDGVELVVEFDRQKLRHDRAQLSTFAAAPRPSPYALGRGASPPALDTLQRNFVQQPFVPNDEHQLAARAQEILAIQTTGLARRLRAVREPRMVIGLSGGLDSTLALLVCLQACAKLGLASDAIHALTLPGPATSTHTLESARALAQAANVALHEIDIRAAVQQHFDDIGHAANTFDVVYENTQARERTQILFDVANQQNAILVGTGDLSELALGWCTYNADHMASYNVNTGVPKTLVSYLVRWYATHRAHAELSAVLQRVLSTPISPELVPGRDGQIGQHTEDLVGPYVLHDFFLFHFVRNGFTPAKIDALAQQAFAGAFTKAIIRRWLKVFFERFMSQQFKRTTLPPGPKVGTVSLSPRGDWRMPDEVSAAALIAAIDELD